MLVEISGYLSSLLFAFCALPQAILCVRQGHAKGVSKSFIIMWLMGLIIIQYYVYNKHGFDIPLFLNYWLCIVFALIITRYMIWPRDVAN